MLSGDLGLVEPTGALTGALISTYRKPTLADRHWECDQTFDVAASTKIERWHVCSSQYGRTAFPMDATEDERLDRHLVEQAQRGDRDAFAVLARTRADRLMAIAQRILRDVGRAEDAVQQTLVIAWRELRSLRDPDRFDAWSHRLLVNVCIAHAGRERRRTANLRVLPIDGPEAPDDLLTLADRDQLERGFRRLSPEQRAILVLHHYLGLDSGEIGGVLDTPAGTARSRLHYAHRAMRALLEADARPTAVARGRSS